MGIIDNETFLPGVITEVESDYSYGYDSSQFGTTDSVVIIGTAFNGPTGIPVEIYNPEHARYIFGATFDSKSKQEATLVASIEDAYQRGCRTIYAVRISGKQVQKDFDLAIDSNFRLRVSGAYPSNECKDYFMVYDNKTGEEMIKVYKPASKATIVEKMQGAVEHDNAVIVTQIRLNQDYGLTKDSTLVDVINIVNNHEYNNVVRLSIVNEEGVAVTNTNIEALSIPLGVLHPGAYFVGRDKSLVAPDTQLNYKIITSDMEKPFRTFEGTVFKDLVFNTDVSTALPIFAKDIAVMREALRDVELFSAKAFDFLETKGLVDRAFAKDKVDYEEVSLSKFDIYQRLGSGYAVTAKAELRKSNGSEMTPRIKETPVGDENRTTSIPDGIYSMLENMNVKYRILSCGNADDKVTGRLPRPKDFLIASPVSTELLDGLIMVTPRVNVDDHMNPKEYNFTIEDISATGALSAPVGDIFTDKVMKVVPNALASELVSTVVKEGTRVLHITDELTGEGELKVFSNGGFTTLNGPSLIGELLIVEGIIYEGVAGLNGVVFQKTTGLVDGKFMDKKFVLAENSERVFAFEVLATPDASGKEVKPLGDIETMFSDNDELTIVYSQSNFFEPNDIFIRSGILDGITVEEFIEMLNSHDSLNHLFSFELGERGIDLKDDYVADVAGSSLGIPTYLQSDRTTAYDYNKYIPYKTADNFARQLAQHCTYTSLKTAPTHGIIGVNPLVDTSLNSIAKRTEELLGLEFELYAKTAFGRNMLDRNNMPYPIGKNVSIPAVQYSVSMNDGYRHVSNGAAGYAGMVSQLPLDQSSTNQPISLNGLGYELTNYQLTRLTQRGYVTVKQSYTKGLVITDGVTMAPAESPFRRLSATRVIGAVEELIREAAEPFIGKQNHPANRNSLQTAIKSNLEKIKGTLIEAYEFNMVVDPKVMKFAYIDIDYKIVPIYEIREVRNRITVKDEL